MLARYYVAVDFVLLGQYAYYSFIRSPRRLHVNPVFSPSSAALLLFVASSSATLTSPNERGHVTPFSKDLGRKNYIRKSCSGLSLGLFVAAFLGNLFYTSSILTSPEVTRDPQYLTSALPFILGAAGTLVFDMAIFIQWIWYNRTFEEKERGEQEYLLPRSSGLFYPSVG
ncbi:Lysosomal amino acid transporter 1 [Neolecta irregularis DAH-3]|uniref:Lysosomal amino acid transporter 1 n=1 Tax=Neolecta irregularis (strain DAH-3) TaxID=1198029 RepID=A0A1U7LM61_NEOID|nr:Lysosomal amino acid transporter 1 [Neolecta irregularis DAH-3]|eukprot:OLL23673.1 Lysosomal amino acid transporter 1 [Neolecta irregularis DAH-3]